MGDGPGYDDMYARQEREVSERYARRRKLHDALVEIMSSVGFQENSGDRHDMHVGRLLRQAYDYNSLLINQK